MLDDAAVRLQHYKDVLSGELRAHQAGGSRPRPATFRAGRDIVQSAFTLQLFLRRMNNNSPRYADWKAPGEDGQLLLWPDAAAMLRQTEENQRELFNSEILIQNLPLGELRARQRRWAGHADDEQPLIASGHQTELYHPGVWVKDALTNALHAKPTAPPGISPSILMRPSIFSFAGRADRSQLPMILV